MRLKTVLATLFLAGACLVNVNPASAMIMDPSLVAQTEVRIFGEDPSNDEGTNTLEIGQSGTMNFGTVQYPGSGRVIYGVGAVLPTNSMITFSYNTTNFVADAGHAISHASSLSNSDTLSVYAKTGGEGDPMSSSSALAFVSAQFVGGDSSSAKYVIKNLSDASIWVLSFLEQVYEQGAAAGLSVSYDVSAVPLPAALPMFGFGLVAMAGLRRRKKSVEAAA